MKILNQFSPPTTKRRDSFISIRNIGCVLAIVIFWLAMWVLGYMSTIYIMTAIYGGMWQLPIAVFLPLLVFAAAGITRRHSWKVFGGGQLILFGLVLWARMSAVGISDHTAEKHGIVFYERGVPTAWGISTEIAIVASSIGALLLLYFFGSFLGRRIGTFIRTAD